jgi:hypothetical protein
MKPIRLMEAATSYFIIVFAFAFLTGVLRTIFLTPAVGATRAVMIEVPFIITVSWITARHIVRRYELHSAVSKLSVGLTSFVLLMAAELSLAQFLNDQSPEQWAAALIVIPGVIGLAAQILFALMPLLIRRQQHKTDSQV